VSLFGKFFLVEISAISDISVRRWHHRWEPVHRRVFASPRMTKDIPALIQDGGFTSERIESGSLIPFPKPWAHCFWGVATPR